LNLLVRVTVLHADEMHPEWLRRWLGWGLDGSRFLSKGNLPKMALNIICTKSDVEVV
jgi:hypothetical protein